MKPINILPKYEGNKWVYKSFKLLVFAILIALVVILFYSFLYEFEKLKELIITLTN